MFAKQLSIFVKNAPGSLSQVITLIARNNINIRALCVADTDTFGILRIIVDEPESSYEALKKAGLTISIKDVLAVKINDSVGGLAGLLKILADNGVDVEYTYAYADSENGRATVVLRIEDCMSAEKILTKAGY